MTRKNRPAAVPLPIKSSTAPESDDPALGTEESSPSTIISPAATPPEDGKLPILGIPIIGEIG